MYSLERFSHGKSVYQESDGRFGSMLFKINWRWLMTVWKKYYVWILKNRWYGIFAANIFWQQNITTFIFYRLRFSDILEKYFESFIMNTKKTIRRACICTITKTEKFFTSFDVKLDGVNFGKQIMLCKDIFFMKYLCLMIDPFPLTFYLYSSQTLTLNIYQYVVS